ncbi:MAG TPA: APC family permease [Gammaproteobacteria bacterium]|nr:APC family permease [Gammaproteobacteria bacterium]
MQFKRSISIAALLFTAIGGIMGSGWLFGPMYVAKIAGPAAVLAWIVGAVLMTVIGFAFAELAANSPVAGGMVQYAEKSHGPLMSFTVGWLVWVSSVVVAPIETLALLKYAADYFPSLVHSIHGSTVLTRKGIFTAAFLMFFMVYINQFGAKLFSRLSTGFVVIKLAVPTLVLITLLYFHFNTANFHQYSGFMPYGWHGILAALPLGGVVFSYIGNSPAIQMAAEAQNPKVALPIAILGSVFICAIVYVLLQIAFIGAINSEDVAQGWNHLNFGAETTGPFAAIANALGLAWLVVFIYIGAIVSPFGTAFIYTGATSRVNYALSKIGFFPPFFSHLNKSGVPWRGLIFNYLVGLFLFMPFPTWQKMMGFIVSCFVISYSIGPLALIPLRKQLTTKNAFELPYGKVFAITGFYICNLLVFWTGWSTVWRLMITVLIGAVVFLYQLRTQKHLQTKATKNTAKWLIPYFIGLTLISYLGTFGGKNILGFGPDFVVILAFSIIIYVAAIRSAASNRITEPFR